jgi:hypothetical protein
MRVRTEQVDTLYFEDLRNLTIDKWIPKPVNAAIVSSIKCQLMLLP